jgi:hypothetical protein
MRHRLLSWMLVVAGATLAAAILLPTPAYSHKPITTNIIFKNEIAQIFQRKCFQCHTENNLGVSFLTYTDARPWARAIREEILERRMPPWTAVRGYGHFANDISLSAREMEIILSWADGGAPSGVLKAEESTPPVYVPPAPAWDRGTPDIVLPVGDGQVIEASAPFDVKRFVVPTGLTAAKRIRSIALRQGDRRVVRHAAFYEEGSGRWLGGWTAWQTAVTLPDGLGYRLAAGAKLIVEIGYSGIEERVTDRSEVGLYIDAGTGASVDGMTLAAPATTLAPKASASRVRSETALSAPTTIVALWPNPSDTARSLEVTATTAEGVSTPLLWIKDYRPQWRSAYFLASPMALPRGTRLVMTTYFDNPSDQATTSRAEVRLLVNNNAAGLKPAATPSRTKH